MSLASRIFNIFIPSQAPQSAPTDAHSSIVAAKGGGRGGGAGGVEDYTQNEGNRFREARHNIEMSTMEEEEARPPYLHV